MDVRPRSRSSAEARARAGAKALSLLSAPLNVQILKALEHGSSRLKDLRYATGSPPQSTMRLYLRALTGIGAIDRKPRNEFPTSVDYAITDTGRGLLEVGEVLDVWLHRSPRGEIELGSTAARNAIRPLIAGWSTTIVQALARRSLSLTELDRLIPRITYPSLERRLGAMRAVGLVDGHRVKGRPTPYSATVWLRRAAAPFLAAIAWEKSYLPGSSPSLGRLDIEAVFLLAIPLIELPKDTAGKCRLAVEVQRGGDSAFAGVLVAIEEGGIASCVPRLDGEAHCWVLGSPRAWGRRLNSSSNKDLAVGGDADLAEVIVGGLRRSLKEPQ